MNALFPLPKTLLEQGSVPSQTIDALRSHGIDLSPTQISQLETHRKELLAEHERFEFDTWGLRVLLEELASSETICPDEFADVAQSAITLFYEVRDAVDPAISDEEIAESIVGEIVQKQGCVECLDSFELASSLSKQPSLAEELAQDEAESTYCWNSEDWEYDEFASGWDGEAWEDDCE
ncbi:DUF6323 family protein [uncultured Senegalimassilia sp.]|uniref:DUF6323 family protein n=1 Tax=uncultured Senegalimassilia sp. TaxID=1714350 RepID=UPI0027DCB021|nr:DUF6323 family protein [uncultured Senegalimassilia sp.]